MTKRHTPTPNDKSPAVSKSALLKFEEIKLIRYEHSLRQHRDGITSSPSTAVSS